MEPLRRQLVTALLFALSLLGSTLACGERKGAPSGDPATAEPKAGSTGDTKNAVNGPTISQTRGVSSSSAVTTAVDPKVNLPVLAEDVRNGDLILTVTATGQVRSDAESKLKSEVGGVVQRVLVRPGDHVKAGQPLVALDPRPFDLALRAAEISVQEADQRAKDNYVPDSIVSGKGPTQERRLNAELRNGLASARVKLDQAKLDREKATTFAPFDGVVDRVSISPGERIGVGQDITTIVDIEHLRIEASVLEHDLPLIKVGGDALVASAAGRDKPVNGKVVAVLPLVDSTTRAGMVYIRAPGNGVLRPGMYADIQLEATRLTNRRIVPAKAVIERDGRPLVFVVKNGRAQWTYVNPGRSNGRETEILADSTTRQIPVKPGDKVITEGHLTLTHDAPVRVIERRDAPAKP
jgi:RND family efflux transporter MFP subunit